MFKTPKIALFLVSAALSTATLAAATAPAWAGETQTVTRQVPVGDLDLGTAAGRAALAGRLTIAAVQACGEAWGDAATDVSGCVQDAKREAMRQVADIHPATVHRGGARYASTAPAR